MKLKTNRHFTRWDGLNILFVAQYIKCFQNFCGSANFLSQIPLKMGKSEEDLESSIFLEAQKYYFVFESRLNFFSNGHICNVVSTLPNVVKINVEIQTVVSTLLNVGFATSRRHINRKTTLNRRWNVCWGRPALFSYNFVTFNSNWSISHNRIRHARKKAVFLCASFNTGRTYLQGFCDSQKRCIADLPGWLLLLLMFWFTFLYHITPPYYYQSFHLLHLKFSPCRYHYLLFFFFSICVFFHKH